jgi:hypothetical protein
MGDIVGLGRLQILIQLIHDCQPLFSFVYCLFPKPALVQKFL